jgi:mevalonate kinase
MSKGLSSSAAMCVLMARAFGMVYDLKLSIRGEMEYGEPPNHNNDHDNNNKNNKHAFACQIE